MSDYIKRGDALNALREYPVTKLKTAIRRLPSVDAAPVRRGYWQITDAYPHNVYCSECHTKYAQTHWEVWEDGSLPRRYCPSCGARMDGANKDGYLKGA